MHHNLVISVKYRGRVEAVTGVQRRGTAVALLSPSIHGKANRSIFRSPPPLLDRLRVLTVRWLYIPPAARLLDRTAIYTYASLIEHLPTAPPESCGCPTTGYRESDGCDQLLPLQFYAEAVMGKVKQVGESRPSLIWTGTGIYIGLHVQISSRISLLLSPFTFHFISDCFALHMPKPKSSRHLSRGPFLVQILQTRFVRLKQLTRLILPTWQACHKKGASPCVPPPPIATYIRSAPH